MSILIKNGTVIDGGGNKAKKADILIEADRIKKIGAVKSGADMVIDAEGCFVTPGFIDVNSDSDHYLTLRDMPGQESLLYQGITTIIGGNCGASLAPLVGGNSINSVSKWADVSAINVNWQKMSEFMEVLTSQGLGVNFGTLVGPTTLRRGILKDEVRTLSPDEGLKMRFLLDQALEEGALGMSVGLAYSHAKITPAEELVDMAKVIRDYRAVFAVHLRGEGAEILTAVKEIIEVAKAVPVSVQISHFKVSGKENWKYLPDTLKMIDEAREKGLEINFDVYPYCQSASVLYILLPDWVTRGGRATTLENLKDPNIKKNVIEELRQKREDLRGIKIADSRYDIFIGKELEEIALRQGVEIEEAIINLYVANGGQVIVFCPNILEENLNRELRHAASFIGSNGAGYSIGKMSPKSLMHPRCFGTFPRFLREAVREKRILSWEEAIHKITGGPAKKYSLAGRGLLKEKYFADAVIFDPNVISDKATFINPFQYSEGIKYLMVNGVPAIEEGACKGKLAGRVLKRV